MAFGLRSVDEYITRYRVAAQAAVPDEQVLAVGILTRTGGLSGALAAQVSGAWYLASKRRGARDAPGLPQNVAVAVTPTRLVVFEFRPSGTSIRLKRHVADWPRPGLTVTSEDTTLAERLTFTFADGEVVRLDSNKSIGQYRQINAQFLREIGCSPAEH
jgi:hypothetical protein